MKILKWIFITTFLFIAFSSFAKPAYSRICPYPHRALPERVIATKNASLTVPKIQILQPHQQQTIWDNQGNVSVNIQVNQALKNNERLLVLVDGKPSYWSTQNFVFILPNIDRGEHTLRAEILNDKDAVLLRSEEITFYLHQTIAH